MLGVGNYEMMAGVQQLTGTIFESSAKTFRLDYLMDSEDVLV